MTDEEKKKRDKRILKRQAETLWQLVITTPGMADLAEPLKRAEHHFDRLTQRQRVTVAVIASQLSKRFHAIETEETQEVPETIPTSEEVTAEIVRPDGVFTSQAHAQAEADFPGLASTNQDDIGDGSGTGD